MTEWILSSTVLMLIVIGMRAVLKGRVGLGLQYALWLLVLVRLLVPINLTESALSILGAAEQAMETPAMRTVTEIAGTRPEVRSYTEARADVVAQYQAQGMAVDSLNKVQLREFERRVDERRSADYTVGDAAAGILTGIWLTGMAVTALCLLFTNLRFGLRLRRSRRALPVSGCPLPVYVTGAVDTPCLFGLFRPAIYLTADAPWDEKAMEHILTHERTHHRHGDHIWSALRCVCLALHWYHPLVWVCANLSRRDGELACDEASIRTLGENRRAEYGRTLIDMTCQKPRGMVGLTATTMICSPKSLRERIQLLARRPKTAAYTLVLVILIAVLAVGCTFTGTPEETAQPTEPVTEAATDGVTEPVTQAPTHGPTEPESPTGPETTLPVEPVDQRLLDYQALFDWSSELIFSRATGYPYSRPEDVDLYYLFYNGVNYPGSWSSIDASERSLLVREGFWEDLDIQIMPARLLDEKLRQSFGVGLEDVRIPEAWVYSSETDTYYSNHNDAYIHVVTVTGYTDLDNGAVVLHLIVDYAQDGEESYPNAPMLMTLRPVEGGWQIVSNEFGYKSPLTFPSTWRAPAEIQVYPFTDEDISEAVSVVEGLMEEFGYSHRVTHISFDPMTTDHWVLEYYAVDRLEGVPLDQYYGRMICMTVSYNGSENESLYVGSGEIEFMLARGSTSHPWVYLHHGEAVSHYPSLLLREEERAAFGGVGEIVAAYRSNDGVNDHWLFVRDPHTGQIRYTAG